MANVTLVGVSKHFGDTVVLDGLDLEIADGEFAVIVGPSGCGKSTLLRLVAGIETLTGGSVYIGARDVARIHPGGRDVAMVFQDYALYPHMTVAKNLSYGMRARHEGTKAEIAARVVDVAKALQIDALLNRKPAQLSGGQRQRVALGRAMMRAPQVYLMDEPLSNLDAALRVQVREDLIQFHRDTGGTILYVTHDQIEAMTMGERVIVMNDGVIQQSGAPGDIYRRPANRFVATFVGSPRMNLMPATVTTHAGGFTIDAGDLRWEYPAQLDGGATFDTMSLPDEVTVGFRPEAVIPASEGNGGGSNAAVFTRELDFVEHIGHEAILRLGDPAGRILARVGATAPAEIGGRAEYRVARADVHVFGSSGEALLHGLEPAATQLVNKGLDGGSAHSRAGGDIVRAG